jgi:hypothetical protein
MENGEKYYIHTAVEIADFMFKRHSHHPVTEKIIYQEKDVIELLNRLGHPSPDWKGNAVQYEKEKESSLDDLDLGY